MQPLSLLTECVYLRSNWSLSQTPVSGHATNIALIYYHSVKNGISRKPIRVGNKIKHYEQYRS